MSYFDQYAMHLRIAEKGKLYALEGKHQQALRHYKEAIKMTENQENGSLFFQHYMQCVMESLELMGAHKEVMSYCEKFLALLDEQNLNEELKLRYKADVLLRWSIQHLLIDEPKEAQSLLMQVQKEIGKGGMRFVDELLTWLQRGYNIGQKQLRDAQKKHHYFIVSKEKVRPEIAMELPEIIHHF